MRKETSVSLKMKRGYPPERCLSAAIRYSVRHNVNVYLWDAAGEHYVYISKKGSQ